MARICSCCGKIKQETFNFLGSTVCFSCLIKNNGGKFPYNEKGQIKKEYRE